MDKTKEKRRTRERRKQENEYKRTRGPMQGTSADDKEEQDDKRKRTMKSQRTGQHTNKITREEDNTRTRGQIKQEKQEDKGK